MTIHATTQCDGTFGQQTSRLELADVGPFWGMLALFCAVDFALKQMRQAQQTTKKSSGEGGGNSEVQIDIRREEEEERVSIWLMCGAHEREQLTFRQEDRTDHKRA